VLCAPRSVTTSRRVLLCAIISLGSLGCDLTNDDKGSQGDVAKKADPSDVVYVEASAVMPMEPYLPHTNVACPNIQPGPNGDVGLATHKDTIHVALADSISSIPEFHDCQRLLVHVKASKNGPASLQYGPLVGVWASAALNDWEDTDFENAAIPTVQVIDYNDLPYVELGIGHGHNCLYLRSVAGAWSARMKQQEYTNACPAIADADFAALPPLNVTRIPPRVEHKDSIPPVARWDWDPVHERHFIGVKCGRAWCEVGKAAFASSPTYPPTAATQHIKGWYDEQQLALPGAVHLNPGRQARIIPVSGLANLTAADFHCGASCPRTAGWVPVATALYNDTGDAIYATKMNLHAGRTAQISMRSMDSSGTIIWQSRIISQKDTAYKKVFRVDHHGFNIPATARWFWRENDEMMWIKCLAGCCSVTSDDS
jgi:hypothetical protein